MLGVLTCAWLQGRMFLPYLVFIIFYIPVQLHFRP